MFENGLEIITLVCPVCMNEMYLYNHSVYPHFTQQIPKTQGNNFSGYIPMGEFYKHVRVTANSSFHLVLS